MITATTTTEEERSFDYARLESALRADLERRASEIRRLSRRVTGDLLQIGRNLLAARRGLEKKTFTKWVESETWFCERHARRLMTVAERFAEEPAACALPHVILQGLARVTTPKSATAEIFRRVGEGETFGAKHVERIVSRHASALAQRKRSNGKKATDNGNGRVRTAVQVVPSTTMTRRSRRQRTPSATVRNHAYELTTSLSLADLDCLVEVLSAYLAEMRIAHPEKFPN